MGNTLYELTGELLELESKLTNPDENQDDVNLQIDICEKNIMEKLNGYGKLMTSMTAKANMQKAEAKRLNDLARLNENAVDRMKERIMQRLDELGMDGAATDLFKFKVCKKGGRQAISIVEESLPEEYQKAVYSPNTEKIREALDRGETVNGCQFVPRGRYLKFK